MVALLPMPSKTSRSMSEDERRAADEQEAYEIGLGHGRVDGAIVACIFWLAFISIAGWAVVGAWLG